MAGWIVFGVVFGSIFIGLIVYAIYSMVTTVKSDIEGKRSESGHEMDKTVAGAVEKDGKVATKEDDEGMPEN